ALARRRGSDGRAAAAVLDQTPRKEARIRGRSTAKSTRPEWTGRGGCGGFGAFTRLPPGHLIWQTLLGKQFRTLLVAVSVYHATSAIGSSFRSAGVPRNWAHLAPSGARWSQESVSVIVGRTAG